MGRKVAIVFAERVECLRFARGMRATSIKTMSKPWNSLRSTYVKFFKTMHTVDAITEFTALRESNILNLLNEAETRDKRCELRNSKYLKDWFDDIKFFFTVLLMMLLKNCNVAFSYATTREYDYRAAICAQTYSLVLQHIMLSQSEQSESGAVTLQSPTMFIEAMSTFEYEYSIAMLEHFYKWTWTEIFISPFFYVYSLLGLYTYILEQNCRYRIFKKMVRLFKRICVPC